MTQKHLLVVRIIINKLLLFVDIYHLYFNIYDILQNFAKVLSQRAVVYLNSDTILTGTDYLTIKASPMLHPMVMKAAKKVIIL